MNLRSLHMMKLQKNKIAYYRKLVGMTQTDLANRIGVARNTVNSYEHDEYDPGLRAALRICWVLRPGRPITESIALIWPDTLKTEYQAVHGEQEPE